MEGNEKERSGICGKDGVESGRELDGSNATKVKWGRKRGGMKCVWV